MSNVYWIDDHILSPIGEGTSENFQQIMLGNSGIDRHPAPLWIKKERPTAFLPDLKYLPGWSDALTRLENMIVHSLYYLIKKNQVPTDSRTLLVLSSTKGNIDLLSSNHQDAYTKQTAQNPINRATLAGLASVVQEHLGLQNKPVVVSNACISGSLALSVAQEYLKNSSGIEYVMVCGADEVSRFIWSGFESFQALSAKECKPFDQDRQGLNLGEAVASVLLGKETEKARARIMATGNRNDANHISGPSRTGEGLFQSILEVFQKASSTRSPDFISAHGTATPYNDEMESIAISRAGLSEIPVHSLKAYYGHTLGASALLETILGVESLHKGILIPSRGYSNCGTSQKLNIIRKATSFSGSSFLKLASGFGGCNIAMLIEKVEKPQKHETSA